MNAPPDLAGEVRASLDRYGLAAAPLVVAVSGGPDSVALLRALLQVRPGGAGPLVVAHLNHQLRGHEADADEEFVRDLAATLPGGAGVRWRPGRIDVAARARETGGNLEAVARRLRYEWLVAVAREEGAAAVATGHTADDQAETVLHRLLRGAGLAGLRGIAARRPLAPGVELVRPLLAVRRADVLAYLARLGQPYRQDRTNTDPRYTRTRIRRELLPLLAEQYNPAVADVLCRLAGQAAEAYRGTAARAAALLAEAERPRAGATLVFDRRPLAAASRHVVREMFRLAWAREGWPQGAMSFGAWDRLAAVARGEETAADLPGSVHARRRGRVVQLSRQT